MPEDRTPDDAAAKKDAPARRTPGKGAGGRQATGSGLGKGASARGTGSRPGGKGRGASGQGGRTRPQQAAVAKPKPWGLIAAAVAVVVFAGAVIGYAVYAVDKSNENRITAADQIQGVQAFDYAAGQQHVTENVSYEENPPVGGPHDPFWADCTGTVYDIDIRHENAVHSLEHGAVWITYDPDVLSQDDISTLADIVQGNSGLMLSPYAGLSSSDLGTPISLESWNHRLGVDSVDDPRIQQYVDFFTYGTDEDGTSLYPEVGASCQNPDFAANPLPADASSEPIGNSDAPTTDSAAPSTASTEPTAEPTATTAP
ncbi:DUF3105 domain-containing protein [Klenkia brasiliensis]|uniref:DUF3105 domain-containing protein n=1 Tax=Klenkia brasiliensis TaxID=333142 RepID=A0A1G7WJM2_9ACTN|nr:DUF3105 domain-containing protein [Klenkia brasiliensis]SDG72029.1 Protein of unknown function [Klenkia brasiliensis]